MENPKITIIVPVYNAEKYLRQCLAAIVNQTMKDIQVICVDDGSKDDSGKILDEYALQDDRILVLTQENAGAGIARNNAMKCAEGEYLLFLDADDFFEPDLCESVYSKAKKVDADIVLYDADIYDQDKAEFRKVAWILNTKLLPRNPVFNRHDLPEKLFSLVAGGPVNKLYRKSFLEEHQLEFPDMRSLEDVPFVYSAIGLAHRISYVNRILYHCRKAHQGVSLVSQIDKHPTRIFDSYSCLKERLIKANVYDELEQTFINRAASDFVDQYLYVIKHPATAEFFKIYLARVGIDTFDLLRHDKRYYVKENVFNELSKIYNLYKVHSVKKDAVKVSIILPVYNVELFIRQSINSLINQTFNDIEIILVDDGSTDDSLRIMQEYAELDPRIKILTQRNQYAGVARNTGMKIATGDYLLFLDPDDFFESTMIEKLYSSAVKYNSDVVLCDGYYFNNETGESSAAKLLMQRQNIPEKCPFSYRDIPNKIFHITIDCPWNKLFNRNFIANANLQFQALRSGNDIYFVDCALALADKISVVDEKLINYRTNVKTSLQANRNKEPLNFYRALTAIKNRLEGEERYGEIETSLQSLFIAGCRHHLNCAKNREEFDVLYSFYLKTAFSEWGMDYPDKLSFVFNSDRIWIQKVLETEPDTYYRELMKNNNKRTLAMGNLPQVILSLTSYPPRIKTLHLVIETLLNQTHKADRIILWLAKDEFPNGESDLTAELHEQMQNGLEVHWCDNLKSHKKYYYVMQKYPEAIVILADDDLLYPTDMVELLLKSYQKYPNAVSAMRCHFPVFHSENEIDLYNNWKNEFSDMIGLPSMNLFSTSGAGTLYPPHCMHSELFNINAIKELCFEADDIWLKIMQVMQNTPTVLVSKIRPLRYVANSQEHSLWRFNKTQNDVQLKNVLERYNCYFGRDTLLRRMYYAKVYSPDEIRIDYNQKTQNIGRELEQYRRRIFELEREIRNIRNSKSYRIGRAVTLVPRKIKGGIRCYKQHGFKYTVKRVLKKVSNKFSVRKKK